MSFGFENLKISAKDTHDLKKNESTYGIESPMVAGLGSSRIKLGKAHPLEASQREYKKNKERMEMLVLRNTQGLHAPLRMAMEIKAAEKVGRLPFLPSSNVMRDSLLGYDLDIGFEDTLNTPEFREQMGQPHGVCEKWLGIL